MISHIQRVFHRPTTKLGVSITSMATSVKNQASTGSSLFGERVGGSQELTELMPPNAVVWLLNCIVLEYHNSY